MQPLGVHGSTMRPGSKMKRRRCHHRRLPSSITHPKARKVASMEGFTSFSPAFFLFPCVCAAYH